jgi:hypothetical protein
VEEKTWLEGVCVTYLLNGIWTWNRIGVGVVWETLIGKEIGENAEL